MMSRDNFGDKSKKYIKILIIFIAVLLIAIMAVLFVIPEIYDRECRTRYNSELDSRIDSSSALSANICVVRREETPAGNITYFSYSLGASGVIFDKKEIGGRYYALTAYHVVADAEENTRFLIQFYDTLPYDRSGEEGGRHLSYEEYYEQFPAAAVEYCDESCDLAVISFCTFKDLGVLDIAESDAEKNTEIAVIGNPEGQRFIRSFGSIISDGPIMFSADDSQNANMAIQHNAFVAAGSSGSAVLNGNMEIVGINIGGGTNFMGRFRYGAMIPCRQIRLFLDNWRLSAN